VAKRAPLCRTQGRLRIFGEYTRFLIDVVYGVSVSVVEHEKG